MYGKQSLNDLTVSTEAAVTKPVVRCGVNIYVDTDPDWIGADIYIHPHDDEGLKIFREFAARMAAHYKTL